MKNFIFSLIRPYGAVFAQSRGGGGGDDPLSPSGNFRRITARLAVLSAVLLAAGTAIIPANAQQATMAIFAPSSGVVDIDDVTATPQQVNLDGNISTIVSRVRTNVAAGIPYIYFRLLNPDGTERFQAQSINSDGLPVFNSGAAASTLAVGDLLRIVDSFIDTSPVAVAQGYVNGNPPDLFLYVSVGIGTASELAAGQFFINENGITTATPAATNIGYAGEPTCDNAADLFVDDARVMCELDCPSDEVENTDATMCMDPLTDAMCNTMMPGSEANDDRN
ncbi:MAG: hypothetical protein ACR2QC_10440, partial [Gammaproteobacteria bacterium]